MKAIPPYGGISFLPDIRFKIHRRGWGSDQHPADRFGIFCVSKRNEIC